MKFREEKNLSFTLTEIVVTVTIFIFIIGTIFSLYIFNQRAYWKSETATEILQNGRVVLERISREIRQTDEIITSLPDVPDNPGDPPPGEILFKDGHLSLVIEEGTAQQGSETTITLDASSSNINDYYKDVFLKIIDGAGSGQTKKIIEYDGTTKIATIVGTWTTSPNDTSIYRMDTAYYYIYYLKDGIEAKRRILVYYFSGDPDTYVPWNDIPPVGQTLEQQILEDEIIGEHVTSLKFWHTPDINIAVSLEKQERILNLQTKVLARNL